MVIICFKEIVAFEKLYYFLKKTMPVFTMTFCFVAKGTVDSTPRSILKNTSVLPRYSVASPLHYHNVTNSPKPTPVRKPSEKIVKIGKLCEAFELLFCCSGLKTCSVTIIQSCTLVAKFMDLLCQSVCLIIMHYFAVEPEDEENPNLRRSRRARCKPLAWYAGERINYNRRKSGMRY